MSVVKFLTSMRSTSPAAGLVNVPSHFPCDAGRPVSIGKSKRIPCHVAVQATSETRNA